ncbi:flagellar motor protein MotB [Bacteroidota bacterium]
MYKSFPGLIILFITINFFTSGQNTWIKPENADCNNAIEIKDTIWGPTNPPLGFGEVMEITTTAENPYLFEKEHHTIWYFFRIPFDCILTFDIIPESTNDDYDFILYKSSDTCFCGNLDNKKPVRSCITRNDISIGSKTGLSVFGVANYFPSGPGPSYCQAIDVKKDEIYYLVLDNVYENGKGHLIHLHYNNPDIENPGRNLSLNINVLDASSLDLINAQIDIYEMLKKNTLISIKRFKDNASCYVKVTPNATYQIMINKKGYLSYTTSCSTSDTQLVYTINANLKSILAGDTLIFENILFYGNSATIRPESIESLNIIYATLLSNSDILIKIRGHVNAPLSRYEPDSYMQLSINRAEEVYKYLVHKGISPKRMSFQGYANNKMLYPYAWKEEEMKMNRRVEVVILGRDSM